MINKILLTLVFLSLNSFNASAQENPTMRSMAAAQLFEYGKALYERADYAQAATIVSKVLSMDPQHTQAISIAKSLNKKGEHITIPQEVVQEVKIKSASKVHIQTKPKMIVKSVAVKQPTIDVPQSNDLTKDIQDANESIKQLKMQVADLRGQLSQEGKTQPIQ